MEFDEYQEQRETLNRFRPKGRGSRGKRKPRKDGKPHTRKHSAKEEAQADDVVRVVVAREAAKIPEKNRAPAIELLKDKYKLDVKKSNSPAGMLNDIAANKAGRRLVILGSKRYLGAIIYVYALHTVMVSAGAYDLDMYCRLISEKTGIPLTPKFNLLRSLCQFAIDYQPGKKHTDHRRKWSRDALAIRWLIKEGIPPHEVVEYQSEKGGGVDKWSKLTAKKATTADKRQAVEVVAAAVERGAARSKISDAYIDDRPETEEELDRIDESPEKARLRKLAEGEPWLTEMLMYYNRIKTIKPGEAMVTLVVGDEGPLGARHIGTYDVGTAPDSFLAQRQLLFKLRKVAKALTRPPKPTKTRKTRGAG